MRRYTTPTHELTVKGVDLTGCDVYVTYKQARNVLTISDPEVEFDGKDTVVTVELSQIQSASFKTGDATVQINWVTPQGARDATNIKQVRIEQNLLEEVVEYGE